MLMELKMIYDTFRKRLLFFASNVDCKKNACSLLATRNHFMSSTLSLSPVSGGVVKDDLLG